MKIYQASLTKTTVLQNSFIDTYMPEANGEFVKGYLYLLRHAVSETIDLSQMANDLNMTDGDINRMINYWEANHLLIRTADSLELLNIPDKTSESTVDLRQNESNTPRSTVDLRQDKSDSPRSTVNLRQDKSDTPRSTVDLRQNKSDTPRSTVDLRQDKGDTPRSTVDPRQDKDDSPRSTVDPGTSEMINPPLSPDMPYEDGELQEILYIATLYEPALNDTDKALLIELVTKHRLTYDQFDTCIEQARKPDGSYDIHEAITQAKTKCMPVPYDDKLVFEILKSMGIKNRGPSDHEASYVKTWQTIYKYDKTLITEACNRAVIHTGKPNFPYADKILQNWFAAGYTTLEEIKKADSAKKPSAKPTKKPDPQNKFNNFEQRSYDFSELEKKILTQNT